MIIDFHTHTFPEKISAKVIHKLALVSHSKPFTDGSVSGLLGSMKEADIDYSVSLPVMTNPEQVVKIHDTMFAEQEALFHQGIISFGGMHPDYTNYKKELLRLKEHQVPGIKLHPAYQNIDLDDIRMLRIIEAASELGLIVLVHAGIDIGIPDHNYSSVSHILKVLHQVQPEKLVLAHMGNWSCWDEVESDLAGAPVWFDTAFSLGPVVPNPEDSLMPIRSHNLSDEAFVRLCKKHGTERILFGTDSPWQEQSDIVERLRALPFSEEEREGILGKNAASLLGLKSQIS